MNYLVDTNILSELVKPKPNPGVLDWAKDCQRPIISVVTVEEVRYGLTLKPNARLESWFETYFAKRCELLEVSPKIADRAGFLRAWHRNQGRQRSLPDMLIAATASCHNLTIASRNERDFSDCGVQVLNPFT